MVQLVVDAKAGKVAPAARPQIQPAKSNNLSKGKKIAIGIAVAVAVIAVIVVVDRQKTHRVASCEKTERTGGCEQVRCYPRDAH